jgi:hypothetical protein
MSSTQVVLDPAVVDQIREYARQQQLGLTVCSSDLPSNQLPLYYYSSRNVLNSVSPFSGIVLGPLCGGL